MLFAQHLVVAVAYSMSYYRIVLGKSLRLYTSKTFLVLRHFSSELSGNFCAANCTLVGQIIKCGRTINILCLSEVPQLGQEEVSIPGYSLVCYQRGVAIFRADVTGVRLAPSVVPNELLQHCDACAVVISFIEGENVETRELMALYRPQGEGYRLVKQKGKFINALGAWMRPSQIGQEPYTLVGDFNLHSEEMQCG